MNAIILRISLLVSAVLLPKLLVDGPPMPVVPSSPLLFGLGVEARRLWGTAEVDGVIGAGEDVG